MKAFVITLFGHPYSESVSKRCIQTARDVGGIEVERFKAIDKSMAETVMKQNGLRWTWANDNTDETVCPITLLSQRPYYGANLQAKIGCAMSHYLLWQTCVELGEAILILEHDAVFIRELPAFEWDGICQINDPRGSTKRGAWWSDRMASRGPGVFTKTHVLHDSVPDGLAGNSAYVIKPDAAERMVSLCQRIGVWPNDALMCRQLIDLQELYPFVTHTEQSVSTSSL